MYVPLSPKIVCNTMQKYISLIMCALLGALSMLTSCTTDEDTTVLTSHSYISNVQLGAMKRTVYYVNDKGEHVPVTTTFKASDVVMSINQRVVPGWNTRFIENKDSLLYGTRLGAVLLDITYSGSYIEYRSTKTKDEEWSMYSSTDSIDMTYPIQLRVYSNDYLSTTLYTLKINVHQMESDSMRWTKVATAEDVLGAMTRTQAVKLKGQACLLGAQVDGIYLAQHAADSVWTKRLTNLPLTAQFNTLRSTDDKLFVTTEDGTLYQSVDGVQWQTLGQRLPEMQLAAVTNERLYVLSDGMLWRSDHSAQKWEQEKVYTTDRKSLPEKVLAGFAYERDNGVQHVVIMGQNEAVNDSACVVWDKAWDALNPADSTTWLFYEVGVENQAVCPLVEHLQVVNFDSRLYAFGGKALKGWSEWVPFGKALYSLDYGLTWRTEKMWGLPQSLVGCESLLTTTVDGNNNLWIIAGNEIWRGRINRLTTGW